MCHVCPHESLSSAWETAGVSSQSGGGLGGLDPRGRGGKPVVGLGAEDSTREEWPVILGTREPTLPLLSACLCLFVLPALPGP